jgi:hypothetical protein
MQLDKSVLSVIYEHGMLRGRDIKRLVNVKDDGALRGALSTLVKRKLVTIQSGSVALESERGILDAYVAPLPSGRGAAEQMLQTE